MELWSVANHWKEEGNLYENFKFMFPIDLNRSFHSLLGINCFDLRLVPHSNSYIEDSVRKYDYYESVYKIY